MFNSFRTIGELSAFDSMPDRLISPGKKDDNYHAQMTRFCASSIDARKINEFRAHTDINRRFSGGDQWVFKEDIDTFLMDSTEDYRNRLTAVFNFCGTVRNKFRGTHSKMTYGVNAMSVTSRSQTRREGELAQLMKLQDIAATSPNMKRALKGAFPMGDSPAETFGMFDSKWRDPYIRAHEHLLKSVAALNGFGEDNLQEADDMFVSGVNLTLSRGYGGDFKQERVDPDLFLWDTNAGLYDLSDGFFMGCAPLMTPTQLYKQWQPGNDVIEYIESILRSVGVMGTGHNSGLINVLQMFWKDIMYQEYGYVMGQNGVAELVPIDYHPPGCGKDYKPKYTRDDRIAPPDTEENNELFGSELSTSLQTEIVRFCDMIPWEYIAFAGDQQPDRINRDIMGDVVLDYGVYPLQPYDPYQVRKVRLPIEASCYCVEKGKIIAPCTDIIFPQRFYNRVMSVSEQQINNSGARAPLLNSDMLGDTNDFAEATKRAKRGEMIDMNTQGLAMQNAFGVLDTTASASALNHFQVGKEVMNTMRLISATPEPVTGQTQGEGLVRTTQMLIQGAGILDEPVYAAITRGKLQRFRTISTAGKEFYLQHTDALADLVTDQDMLVLLLSRDYEMERFDTQVVRGNDEQTERAQANELMLKLFQMQLLGQADVAELFNQATTDEVAQAMRLHAQDLLQAQKQQAEQMRKEAVTAQIAQRDQQLNDQAQLVHEQMMDAANKEADRQNKNKLNYTREDARARGEVAVAKALPQEQGAPA